MGRASSRRCILATFVCIVLAIIAIRRLTQFEEMIVDPTLNTALNQMNDLQLSTRDAIDALQTKLDERSTQIDSLSAELKNLKSQMADHLRAEGTKSDV